MIMRPTLKEHAVLHEEVKKMEVDDVNKKKSSEEKGIRVEILERKIFLTDTGPVIDKLVYFLITF